jgi:hypothetical protein
MGVTIRVARCGRCGKPRGLTHTCVTSMTRKSAPGRTRLAPRATVTCGRCGKPRGLAHTCTVRSDFKQRKAAEQRRQVAERKRKAAAGKAERRKAAAALRRGNTVPAARPRSGQHDFRACRDAHCQRFACLTWKEAFREGYSNGYDKGYETGYDAGFAAGIAACPRPHEGG